MPPGIASARMSSDYSVLDQYIHKTRCLRVVIVGAGLTGIAAVHKLDTKFKDLDITYQIYEKNHDVGGTWLENRYPGCACDVPAHSYTYSWEGNPEWSRFYAGSNEIWTYYKSLSDKYGVNNHTRFNSRVLSATWNNDDYRYELEIEDVMTGEKIHDHAAVLINASGWLNSWKWPDIEGLNSFKGGLYHTANWKDHEFQGKTVAVIGSGSSGIQIVPQLQPYAKKLISFNRSATWITPEFGEDLTPQGRGREAFYSDDEKLSLQDSASLLKYRKRIEDAMNATFYLFKRDSEEQKQAVEAFTLLMQSRLKGDERLCKLLIPNFGVGCRRFTPGHGYLEALVADNAEVVTEEIIKISEKGLHTQDGKIYEVDMIVCATGFNTSFCPNFDLIGLEGQKLQNEWNTTETKSYLSIAAAGYPNYFMTSGPNAPLGNGPVLPALEKALDYAFSVTRKISRENIAYLFPKRECVDEFIEHKNEYMKMMVWSDRCRSWYKQGREDGPVTGPWCGSTLHYLEAIGTPRYEDYVIKYRGRNRYIYLGNGKSEVEGRQEDMSWYIGGGTHPFRSDLV